MAVSADNGKILWQFDTRAGVIAAPITYTLNGEQYVTVLAGNGGAMGLIMRIEPTHQAALGRVLTFKLGGKATLPVNQPIAWSAIPECIAKRPSRITTRSRPPS